MPTILNGWHRGERVIHDKLNLSESMATAFNLVQSYMPDQHRIFHSHNLPFVPITTLDAEGRPWSSIIAGASGKPGFIQSPKENLLTMDVKMWYGDPLIENFKRFGKAEKTLIAGIGIDFSNRRRNKFAGHITKMTYDDDLHVHLDVEVNQAIG